MQQRCTKCGQAGHMRTNKSCPLWDPNDHVRQKDTYNQNVATKLGYDEATKRRSIKLSINASQVERDAKADKDQKKLKFKVDLKTLPENQRRLEAEDFHSHLKNKGRDASKQVEALTLTLTQTVPSGRRARTCPISPLHLPYISPISPLIISNRWTARSGRRARTSSSSTT